MGRPGVDAGGERRHGEKQRGREGERGTWGSFINKLKFKIKFINSVFLLLFGFKRKTFKYESCSKLQILQLSFQAQIHLKLNLKDKFFKLECI